MSQRRIDLLRFVPFRFGRLAERADTDIGEVGLVGAEWQVLCMLGRTETTTAQAIVRATGIHKTRVSRAVADLVERGLVTRTEGRSDRRQYTLALTLAGRAMLDELDRVAVAAEQRILAPLEPEERRLLDRLLNKLEAVGVAD